MVVLLLGDARVADAARRRTALRARKANACGARYVLEDASPHVSLMAAPTRIRQLQRAIGHELGSLLLMDASIGHASVPSTSPARASEGRTRWLSCAWVTSLRPTRGDAGTRLAPDDSSCRPSRAATRTLRAKSASRSWCQPGPPSRRLWLVWPMGLGVLLGVLIAFTVQPTYARMTRRLASSTAALAVVLGSTLVIVLSVVGLVWVVVRDGMILGRSAADALHQGGGAQKVVLVAERLTSRFGISNAELVAKAHTLAASAAGSAAAVAQHLVSAVASIVLAVFFIMLTLYFLLRRWQAVLTILQETLPLRPDYTLKLLQEFRRVGRATLLSTVLVGLLQGALATVGYLMVGLPQPLFFGVLTAIASLAPGVGTMLVWLPVGIVLTLLGRIAGGLFLLVWGMLVLTAIPTYVISPRVVGAGAGRPMPALFAFISLFGGAAVFGLKGSSWVPCSWPSRWRPCGCTRTRSERAGTSPPPKPASARDAVPATRTDSSKRRSWSAGYFGTRRMVAPPAK